MNDKALSELRRIKRIDKVLMSNETIKAVIHNLPTVEDYSFIGHIVGVTVIPDDKLEYREFFGLDVSGYPIAHGFILESED